MSGAGQKGLYQDPRTGIWYLDFTTIGGERHRFSLRTRDRKQAERIAWKERERIQLEEQQLVTPRITVRELFNEYLAWAKHRRSESTMDIYRRAFDLFAKVYGDRRAGDVRRRDVDDWVTSRFDAGAGRGSIRIELSSVRRAYNWGKERGNVLENPCPKDSEALGQKEEREVVYLTPDELERLLDAAGEPVPLNGPGGKGTGTRKRQTPIRAMIAVATMAGLRRSEMLYLDREDVDFGRDRIHVRGKPDEGFKPKTRRERTIALFAPLKAILQEHIASRDIDSGGLFLTSNGTRIGKRNAGRALEKAAERAGDDIAEKVGGSWNVLRHTFGTRVAQEGVPLFQVSKWMGNSVPVVEKHYAGIAPDKHRDLGNRAFGAEPEPEKTSDPKPPTEQGQGEGNAKIIQFPGWGQTGS